MAEKQWTIAISDEFHFDIVPVRERRDGSFGSDADLNGSFPTKLAALEELITEHEKTRAAVSKQIARAKRMCRRLMKANPNG
jgi:hypothetical protein